MEDIPIPTPHITIKAPVVPVAHLSTRNNHIIIQHIQHELLHRLHGEVLLHTKGQYTITHDIIQAEVAPSHMDLSHHNLLVLLPLLLNRITTALVTIPPIIHIIVKAHPRKLLLPILIEVNTTIIHLCMRIIINIFIIKQLMSLDPHQMNTYIKTNLRRQCTLYRTQLGITTAIHPSVHEVQ